jgi:hypothetical protein
VCIKLKRADILEAVGKHPHLHMKPVTYLKLDQIRRTIQGCGAVELPFLKRHAFEREAEFRIIYTSEKEKLSSLGITVPLSSIEKITLSSWMHPNWDRSRGG